MQQLQEFSPVIGTAGAVVALVALVGWISLLRRFQRFARPYEELAQAAEKEGVPTALQTQLLGVERNAARIESTFQYAQQIETQLRTALQGVGFLKYDAFEDIRGSQSYSLCLLDAHQNGVIISSIAGRNDYRGYAKPVKNGNCDLAMSDEEKQVLDLARGTIAPVIVAPKATPAPAPAAATKPEPVGAGA